jgi:transposase
MSGCKDCEKFQKHILGLEEKIALLQFEFDSLKSRMYKPNKKKPPKTPPAASIPSKKKGGILGHIGFFRKKPLRIDRVEDIIIDKCPACGFAELKECSHIEEHIQEDIICPATEAVLYKRRHYYCLHCKKVVSAKGKDELPKSHIGPNAKSLAVFMKYVVKISDRDIRAIFKRVFNLDIAVSSVAGFKEQLKIKASLVYEQLLHSLRKSPFVHADETGWRIDGINHWLWKFSNKKISLTHIDKSRGQRVVEDILGDDYNGVLITDFLSAYNKIRTPAKQRCLVHLLRDLKKVIIYFCDDKEVLRYSKRLKELLEDAISLHKDYQAKPWDSIYLKKREFITQRLLDFRFPNPSKKVLQRFVKRLNRHKDELFCFLYHKNIDYHNNHAEQQIRPDVIFRKITFQNRSLKGAENHQVLMSVLQTAKLNNIDPIKTLHQILLSKNPLSEIVSSAKRAPPQIQYVG